MQKTKHVFRALAWGMVTMGVIMGAIFPLFVMLFGVAESTAFSLTFILATLVAGLVVGVLNFALASKIVRPRLARLSQGMRNVSQAMDQATFSGDWSACDPATCQLQEEDEGELGAVANSYNALLYALHDAHRVEGQIRSFTQTLSSRLDLTELGDQALTLLQEISGAQGGAIVMDRQAEWKILVSHGLNRPEQILESQLFHVRQEVLQRRIVLPPGVTVDAVLTHFIPADVILAPVLHHGLVLGWVVLASSTPFAEQVPRLLPLLMQGLGLALNNALMHADLQRVAALDPLTNIYNRRFGMKRLEEELSRAGRNRSSLALIMLDLDHFKRINDTFGHLSGDKVLVRTANVTRGMLRDGDILLRYGGEEFVVVLPGASVQDARDVAERIRFAIGHTSIDVGGEHALTVTASIGVTAMSGDKPVSPEELIAQADARMYAAKAAGRDRVVFEGNFSDHT